MLLRRIFASTIKTQLIKKGDKLPGGKYSRMAEHQYMSPSLNVILERLEQFAPAAYASSWDNVGLLVDPNCNLPIDTILITNDLTEEIVEEAKTAKVQLIISYHPNIFHGLKAVSTRTWKERIIVECIKHKIAVFSPHTAWDAVKGGVNDWLARCLPLLSSAPIIPHSGQQPEIGAGRFCNLHEAISISAAIEKVKKHIGVKHLRLALAKGQNIDSQIKTVAVCAGSGSSVLNGIQADLYLTGEMMHHDVLDATQNGISVILCNHTDSERGFLREFCDVLQNDIFSKDIKVIHSAIDRDPLMTV